MKNMNCEAPHYAVVFIFLLLQLP